MFFSVGFFFYIPNLFYILFFLMFGFYFIFSIVPVEVTWLIPVLDMTSSIGILWIDAISQVSRLTPHINYGETFPYYIVNNTYGLILKK